jgi:hypothetical protein
MAEYRHCSGGKHDLAVIFERHDKTAPDAFNVVRWCANCGAIVVDDDVDGRTAPGGYMPMKFPRIALAHGVAVNPGASDGGCSE